LPDPLPLASLRRFALIVHGLAVLTLGCGPSDPASLRVAEITAILETHMEHEHALLDILESNRRDAAAAETRIDAYLARHGAAMAALGAKRLELEADPTALATAMRALEPEMNRIFERRRRLAQSAPDLMSRDKVRAAIATLDEL